MSAEAFRNLRTSILYSSPDHPLETLMVTSLQPEDGKTSMATNLAIALGQLGSGEVLLIDATCDTRTSTRSSTCRAAPASRPFSRVGRAAGGARPTEIPNLYVIPAGRLPHNPAELLASARLAQALQLLREQFAHVIFDAPPLIGDQRRHDPGAPAGGVVLVLRHGRATGRRPRGGPAPAQVRAKVLGVVLNGVDARTVSRRYRRWNYYGARRARDDDTDDV